MLDIHQLRIFLAVWQEKGFSGASRAVYLTQPTVSGHIKALEEALNTKLFDRTGKEVLPTKAGEALYPYAKQILHLVAEAEEAMSAFVKGESGRLRIGGSNIPGQYLLPDLIGRFKTSRKDVNIVLRISDTAGIIDMVASGEIELGIAGACLERPELIFEPCMDDQMVLIVPKGHRLDGLSEIDLNDVLYEPFIVREKGSGSRLAAERALTSAGWPCFDRLNIVAEIGSTEAVRQAIKAGLGLAIISRKAVEEEIRTGIFHAASLKGVDLRRRFYLLWRKDRTLSPLALAFIDLIKSIRADR
ncbi:MAG: selenium metabolism-associated LysR family transcriptional regulator [Dissulfurimicrobium sp.]|uniref:selenium metabolism-associated LysR family transcriptional regulator n=1 Tax=Dissulfurimicrobium sp. TaxID=2022436 RepID=UPI003D146B97